MKLDQLFKSIPVEKMTGSLETEISGIFYDSRQVRPDGLFVAILGAQVDGLDYISDAVARGAVAVVSEKQFDSDSAVTYIQVSDARRALAEISNIFYGDLSRQMKVVGITGTNGKTTTAYMIRALLAENNFKPGLLGTVAYEVGDRSIPAARTTPEAPEIHTFFEKMRAMDCDSAVMEVSSHALALQRTFGIKFAIAVFTNLTQDHLDYHLDMESYFAEKTKLFTAAQACVINLDDPWGRKLMKNGCMSYGFSEQAKVRATREKLGAHGTQFRVQTPWGNAKIQLSLLGRFNIHNALAAIATGGLLGIPLNAMVKSLANLPHVPGRLEEVQNRKRKKVFVDYAHTDDALRNVLETLREICKGKLIVLFGCGGNRDRGKRKKMGQVAAELADYSIVTSDNPRKEDPQAIVDEILMGFTPAAAVEVVLDRREAIERGLQKMGRRDIFLVAGKGHETYQELRDTTIPFNDRETIQELLG